MKKTRKQSLLQELRKKQWYKSYTSYLRLLNIKIEPLAWIIASAVLAVLSGFAAFFVLDLLELDLFIFAFIFPILVLDAMLGLPYLNAMKRVDTIEKTLPDALKQISDILRSGSTYESALKEVATPDFGPLGEEMQAALRKLEEGENFASALNTLSRNIDSKLVRRVITIVIDAVKAGAGLADVLEQIAEDARETYRIRRERKVKTLLQVLFILMSGSVVTPFIFGMISQIVVFLIDTAISSGVTISAQIMKQSNTAKDTLFVMIQVYLFFEVVASSLMIAIMSEGKATKSLIYFPALLLVAFIIFHGARIAISLLLSQVGGVGMGI